MPTKYVAIEGPIGVGKTTLAKMLADHYGGRLVLEQHEENPFLSDFYKDRRKLAFQTQLFFLLSRFKQQQELFSGELFASYVIADYLFAKDRIFASLNLDENELALYDRIAALLEKNIPSPDLVIYLTASPRVLLARIGRRGRHYEKNFDADYLKQLCQAYSKFFFHYNATPLLVVNTENVNFSAEPHHFSLLLEHIQQLKQGTSYLVPTGGLGHA